MISNIFDYSIKDLIDIGQLRSLLESHHLISDMGYFLLSHNGEKLVSIGTQEICNRFHRNHPVCSRQCSESDAQIKAHLIDNADTYFEDRCANGIINVAFPIIIEGHHLATFFSGQFFFDDDPPDREFFYRQALKFGFDPTEYLKALDQAPVFSRDHVRSNLSYLHSLMRLLSASSLKSVRLANEIEQHRRIEEQYTFAGFALDQISEAAFIYNEGMCFKYVNREACHSLGYSRDELLGMSPSDIDPGCTHERVRQSIKHIHNERSHTVETRHQAKNGRIFPVEVTSTLFEHNGASYILSLVRDISERKLLEEERDARLTFFANLDTVNRAIQGTNDLAKMLNDVLNSLRLTLNCDRAYLACPCDPEAEAWNIHVECTAPEYPGANLLGETIPADNDIVDSMRLLLSSAGPVAFGFGSPYELSPTIAKRFAIKSMLAVAVYPKVGNPWLFAVHQCACNRVWSPDEKRFFKEVGRRLGDALSAFLTHRELQESENKYRSIVDTAAEGIMIIEPDLRSRFVNHRMAEMLGFSDEEMICKRVSDFMFDEDALDPLQKLKRQREGKIVSYDCCFRHSDGRAIWTHVSSSSIFDADGCFSGILAMCTDITERRKMEQQLTARERLLSTLLDNFPDFIARFDTEGRHLFVNQTVTNFFGMTLDEFVGTTLPSFEHSSDENNRRLHEAILQTVARGEANALETEWRSPEGYRYFEVRHIPEKDNNGVVVSVLGIARDITDKRLMENKLKESEAKYRHSTNLLTSILESATDVSVYALDRQYRYLAFNRSHKEWMNGFWGQDITVGQSLLDAFAGKCREGIHSQLDKVLAGCSLSIETRFKIVKDGRERYEYLEKHGSPILNDDGEVTGLTFYTVNVTERKSIEEKLRRREQQFRTLAENSPGLIVRYDRECRRVYVNPAFTQKTHIQAAEALGKSPVGFWTKFANITAEGYIAVLQKVMETGTQNEILLEFPDPVTGRLSYHLFQIVAEKNDEGEVLGCLAIDLDITRFKEMQLKLDRLAEVFPGVLCHFCMKPDGAFCMPYASHGIQELFGLSHDEIKDDMSAVFNRVHPDDYEQYMDSLIASTRKLSPWHSEFRLFHPENGDVWVEGNAIPERQPDGSITWYGFVYDITDRKLNEEALNTKRLQLAELASELTLAEERERQNIATMLHDHIGQTLLLGRIKLGTLAEEQMPATQQKKVEEIKELLDQVTQNIHELTVQLSPPILATAGLEAALEWLGRRIEEDYGLFVEFDDDMRMKPLSDEVRSVVYQCGRELLINVARHAKVEDARIVVARDSNRYRLTIEDDGVGFDLATLGYDSSKAIRFGLLSIEIRMERLGGSVVYESSPGQGSRMTLLAPLADTDM